MATKKTTQKTYTISEAAKRLGVSRAAIYKAIKDQRLNAEWVKTVVRTRVVSAESIDSYQVDSSRQERGKKN
jgi:excisionase family DNA binding protein